MADSTVAIWDHSTYTRAESGSLLGPLNMRFHLAKEKITGDGCTAIALHFKGKAGNEGPITHVSIGIQSSATAGAFAEAPTIITFNGGNASVTLASASGTVLSDFVAFDWSTENDYLIHIYMGTPASWWGYSRHTDTSDFTGELGSTVDWTTVIDATGYTARANWIYVVDQIYGRKASTVSTSVTGSLFFCHG